MPVSKASEIFREVERELWLVTAQSAGRRGGLIATFVNQASLPPELPRVLVGLAKQHNTWSLIEESRAFGLHLLSEEQIERVWRFGLHSGRDLDKLAGLPLRAGITGTPMLADAIAWLECRVETQLDTGDRTVYLAEVLDADRQGTQAPLTNKSLSALATPDLRRDLLEQMKRDCAIDAEAIQAWRRSHA